MSRRRTVDPTGAATGTERLSVRLSLSQHRNIHQLAASEGVSVGEYVRRLLADALDIRQAQAS